MRLHLLRPDRERARRNGRAHFEYLSPSALRLHATFVPRRAWQERAADAARTTLELAALLALALGRLALYALFFAGLIGAIWLLLAFGVAEGHP